jgi:SET domain-containing protein
MKSFWGALAGKKNPAAQNARMNFHFCVAESRIDGQGLFASAAIPARRKLGEFTGQVISQARARRRARGQHRIAIVELNDGRAIDASRGGNDFRYINHSCSPNAYIRISNGRVEFYSRRTIRAGEEITCDYGETHHEGKLRCQCGSKNCRGSL